MIVTCQLVASSCYVSPSMTGIIQQYQALYVCSPPHPPPQPLQGHDGHDFDRCSQSASKQIDWTEYTSCELDDGCPVAAHFGCNMVQQGKRKHNLKASVQTLFFHAQLSTHIIFLPTDVRPKKPQLTRTFGTQDPSGEGTMMAGILAVEVM